MVVSSSTLVRNFSIVSDVVSEHVRGVIVEETWGEPKHDAERKQLTIALAARVSPQAVADGACAALRARHSARVAVVIASDADVPGPNGGTSRGSQPQFGVALLDELKGGCMSATLVSASAAEIETQSLLEGLRARSGGDIALFVKRANPSAATNEGLTARIVDLSTNEILAVANGGPSRLADALFKQIATHWTKELNEGRRISFSFATTSFAAAGIVQRAVAQALGVAEAKDQALRNGELRFTLFVPSDGVTAAKTLEGLRVGDRTLTVTSAERGAIALAYSPQ